MTLDSPLRNIQDEKEAGGETVPSFSSEILEKSGAVTSQSNLRHHLGTSNWLAKHEDIDRLLMRLGHYSSKVLWEHYHKAVLKKDAEKFWRLMPVRNRQ